MMEVESTPEKLKGDINQEEDHEFLSPSKKISVNENDEEQFSTPTRRSTRRRTINPKYSDPDETSRKRVVFDQKEDDEKRDDVSFEEEDDFEVDQHKFFREQFEGDLDVDGKRVFGFNTPKKRDGMAIAAACTPKTPKTPKATKTPDAKKKRTDLEPKTPRHIRNKVRLEISKLIADDSQSDISADESDFEPEAENESEDSSSAESAPEEEEEDTEDNNKNRRPLNIPILPKTPTANRVRSSTRKSQKSTQDFIPESDGYFHSHHNKKIITSDHTLDRLKNPRLPADRLFTLLAEMKVSEKHEEAISTVIEEYKTNFSKWLYILNEGYNILLYGLGSKRNLLQSFHREVLCNQTVLMVNGFFPSLTIKDILNNITSDILELSSTPANPHEIVNIIEDEFALVPTAHLYLIIHNIDGPMLRNTSAQEVLSRLAKIPNMHLLASIDHINTPLIWDHRKLSDYNFSWWDCTSMLPYTDETAFENSLLVQNSGELALSSMRSVFQSLTQNAKGVYIVIVKHQLKNKGNQNYQGMPFKDLYWGCREAFLVSSDLALRAQLTEFLDHKMIKSKRSVDGSEQLQIPMDSALLQQFLDEHEQK